MRKIGAHVSVAGGLVNAIKNTQAINGNCLQIFAGSPRSWARTLYPQAEADQFRQSLSSLSLEPLFIHALYLVNLGTDNNELLSKSMDSLSFDMKNGDLIGAAGVIVHVGSHQGRGFASVKSQIVQSIQGLLSFTTTTNFVIENSAGQKGKIGSLQELSELIEAVNSPRLKVCLDTAHLYESGCDFNNQQHVDQLLVDLNKLNILDSLTCLHLNDSKTTLGSFHDQHANLGEGEIGLQGLANIVNHPRLKHLPLILEVPGDKGFPDQKQISIAQQITEA